MYIGACKAEHCVLGFTRLIDDAGDWYYNTALCGTVFLITAVCSINNLIIEYLLLRRPFNMISFVALQVWLCYLCQPNKWMY